MKESFELGAMFLDKRKLSDGGNALSLFRHCNTSFTVVACWIASL